jgi:hypothetical protein
MKRKQRGEFMGCEFSDRVRTFKRGIIMDRFDLLSEESKKAFLNEIGDIKNVKDDELAGFYRRLGRTLRAEGTPLPKWGDG